MMSEAGRRHAPDLVELVETMARPSLQAPVLYSRDHPDSTARCGQCWSYYQIGANFGTCCAQPLDFNDDDQRIAGTSENSGRLVAEGAACQSFAK